MVKYPRPIKPVIIKEKKISYEDYIKMREEHIFVQEGTLDFFDIDKVAIEDDKHYYKQKTRKRRNVRRRRRR